ncbi:hypothetical protein ACTXT7_016915 [Hymenolepis weldensis]
MKPTFVVEKAESLAYHSNTSQRAPYTYRLRHLLYFYKSDTSTKQAHIRQEHPAISLENKIEVLDEEFRP